MGGYGVHHDELLNHGGKRGWGLRGGASHKPSRASPADCYHHPLGARHSLDHEGSQVAFSPFRLRPFPLLVVVRQPFRPSSVPRGSIMTLSLSTSGNGGGLRVVFELVSPTLKQAPPPVRAKLASKSHAH